MAYLLGKRERVLDGVRRVVIEELNAAAKSLRDSHPSSEKRIHAARNSVKKVRYFWRRSMRPAAAALRAADGDCVR